MSFLRYAYSEQGIDTLCGVHSVGKTRVSHNLIKTDRYEKGLPRANGKEYLKQRSRRHPSVGMIRLLAFIWLLIWIMDVNVILNHPDPQWPWEMKGHPLRGHAEPFARVYWSGLWSSKQKQRIEATRLGTRQPLASRDAATTFHTTWSMVN